MYGCLIIFFASLPGFLLGLIIGKWGVYLAVALVVLYTLCGIVIFSKQPRSQADLHMHHQTSKIWTYSVLCLLGSLLGAYLRNGG